MDFSMETFTPASVVRAGSDSLHSCENLHMKWRVTNSPFRNTWKFSMGRRIVGMKYNASAPIVLRGWIV